MSHKWAGDAVEQRELVEGTAQLLQAAGVEFASRDVLQDPELREGVKKFSEWPTIPQIYVAGEFLGGSDTLFEMFTSGDLDTMLDDKGIKRIAADKQ